MSGSSTSRQQARGQWRHYFNAKCPFHASNTNTRKCLKGFTMEVQAKDVLSQSEEMDIMGRMDAHIWSLHERCLGRHASSWWAHLAVSEHGSFSAECYGEEEEEGEKAASRSRSPHHGRSRAAPSRPGPNLGDLAGQLQDLSTDNVKEIFVLARLELAGRGVDVD
jgi:hypothetical protein